MNKQTIKTPATAAAVVDSERVLVAALGQADRTVGSWFTAALDARRGKFSRDAKGTASLQKDMQQELVEAAIVAARTPKKDGGMGMSKKAVDEAGETWFKVLALVLSPGRIATYRSYFAGIARAHAHEAPWHPRAHFSPDKGGLPEVPWKGGAQGATTAGVATNARPAETGATVKVDAGAREVKFTAGSKGTDPQSVATILTAIGSDPGRVALALAYCKAQGWI